jgi:carbamoyl-phosphate synthase small subunit
MGHNPAYIYLEDGTQLEGEGFGSESVKSGELVFTTSMNGYPESLTDPSYAGEILVITHPLVGNYGVPEKIAKNGILSNFESERIQAEGLIVSELTTSEKWNSSKNLGAWMKEDERPGVRGVDTRALTKRIRDRGAMMCIISTKGEVRDPEGEFSKKYTTINYVEKVSPKKPVFHKSDGKTVVIVDAGVKHGILSSIASLGYNIVRVPYTYSADQIMSFKPSGVLYSNGPGNPNMLKPLVTSMQDLWEYKLPIFGICLGHQIAALAMGGKVEKMKFGHRAINKGVVDEISKSAYITSHNHGYAVMPNGVPEDAKIWLMSRDDNVVEGMICKSRNMITTQFHPEGKPGTNDAAFIFKMFDRMIKEQRQ